ncbi:MAG: hypothetical protein ABEJ65_07135, partial [bacterium]
QSVELHRDVEELPDEREFQERIQAGRGITRPELCVILSYTKMDLYKRSLEQDWSNDWIIQPFISRYFPEEVISQFPKGIEHHPLKGNCHDNHGELRSRPCWYDIPVSPGRGAGGRLLGSTVLVPRRR